MGAEAGKPSEVADSTSPRFDNSNARMDDIEYIYLEFDTDIAIRPFFSGENVREHPPCPDLTNYDNPFTWSKKRKNLMTYVSCITNGAAAYASGSYIEPEAHLTQLWGITPVAYTAGLTIFTFAFGIAPMFLAPFSEVNGRRPVFIATGLLFVICQIACALTDSFAGLLVARFFAGVGASTSATVVGGILADIWVSSERNAPLVYLTGATIFGTGLGPCVSGFVAQHLLWRWVFYISAIISGVLVALVAIFFKETRGHVVLSQKAKLLNKWYTKLESLGATGMEFPETPIPESADQKFREPKVRRIRYKVLAEEQRASVWKMIAVSLKRPAHLLLTEPIVICFSTWFSFSWAILYLQFGAIPLVFRTNYGFTLEQTGAVFAAVSVGGIIMTVISIYQDRWAAKKFGEKFTKNPEGRLWFTCAEGLLMPVGMFWFGWTCYSSIHWIVPTIGIVAITMGIFSIFLANFNYMADAYRTYASSALAASGVCRNLLGGSFPLITVQMFTGMGFQAASSLLGGIGFLLAIGPIALIWFGPQIRARSKVARQFVESD